MKQREIFIDPSYRAFEADGLFDLSNPVLNRDGQLRAFHRLRKRMADNGVSLHTADLMSSDGSQSNIDRRYYSLGILENFERILAERRARLSAFVIMEPPVVAPYIYQALPRLTAVFDRVYLPNIVGDGYSLVNVDQAKLHRLYWPIPYDDVLDAHWNCQDRMKRVVVINGSHNPHGRDREQYSLRIDAMAALSQGGHVDLYGVGWDRWWSRSAMWLPYWKNFRSLMNIYKGRCSSKFDVLSQYDFCLCFENMSMKGYITEKIFDCLYAGTIPLYLGATDILEYVPAGVFVDCRKYSTWDAMWKFASAMSQMEIDAMRNAGRSFLQGKGGARFYNSLDEIVGE